jgi:hypothetical protein
MLASAVGFGLAAAYFGRFANPINGKWLFIGDAATFILAAAIIFGIPSLGGGAVNARVSGAIRRSWNIIGARPYLVISTLAAFFIPMSLPALVALAYKIAPDGSQAYSTLEGITAVGIFVGSLIVSRSSVIGTLRTAGAGLLLTGVFSVAIATTLSFPMVLIALLIASIGNPVYSVATQTALVEAADSSSRGSVMATRFGLAQMAGIVGISVGGLVTRYQGASYAYGILGIGLVILALYALAAGRSTVNPLHGAAYEEATALQQAKT